MESVKKDAKGVTASFKDRDGKAQMLQGEKTAAGGGTQTNDARLGLDKSKAKLERGFVQANQYMEMAEPGPYAEVISWRSTATGTRSDDGRNRSSYVHRGETDAADPEDTSCRRDVWRIVNWVDRSDGSRRATPGTR